MTSGGPWTWDPRRDASYRSRDGRTWGHLGLLVSAIREVAKTDPALSQAQRIRRRGMLKVASLAAVFGMYAASTPRPDAKPETLHRVITSDGIVAVTAGTPERPGPYAFPPGAALVEGAGRLMLTVLIHEVRARGGAMPQVDTDGGFIVATADGVPLDAPDRMIHPLSFGEIQQVRERFSTLARWSRLPIVPDRLEGRRIITGEGVPSLLKFADPMVGPDGELGEYRCYTPSLRRFVIRPEDGAR